MEANFGLGSPQLLFYFPIPFYITSLFYPLRHLGLELSHIYVLGIYTASVTTFVTATLWLQTVTTRKRAALCAFILLCLPYRMEVLGYRHSYAELWVIALLPLLFLYVRKLITTQERVWPQLSLITALCLLCHLPATLIGMMGAGAQIIVLCWRDGKKIAIFAGAGFLGLIVSLFHFIPAMVLAGFLNEQRGGVSNWRTSWVNNYVFDAAFKDNRIMIGLGFCMLILLLSAFMLLVRYRREFITDTFVRREIQTWFLIVMCSCLLMFPITEPLWSVIELFSQVKTPWRMQILLILGMAYFMAISLQWILPRLSVKFRDGDGIAFSALLAFMGLTIFSQTEPASESLRDRVNQGGVSISYFMPRWVDAEYADFDDFIKTFAHEDGFPKARFSSLKNNASIIQWDYDGINVSVNALKPDKLLVEQFYFPTWHATLDGKPVDIIPAPHKGRMLLDIPAGKHEVRLYVSVVEAMPPYYRWIWLSSLIAALAVAYGCYLNCTQKRRLA